MTNIERGASLAGKFLIPSHKNVRDNQLKLNNLNQRCGKLHFASAGSAAQAEQRHAAKPCPHQPGQQARFIIDTVLPGPGQENRAQPDAEGEHADRGHRDAEAMPVGESFWT